MYINFEILSKNNFSWAENELLVLQIIKQKQYDLLESCSKDLLNNLYKNGYIQLIKGNKNVPKYMLVRLSEKAKKFLKDISVAEITSESKELAAKLISLYQNNNLTINNKKKVVEMVSWFLSEVPDFTADKIYETVENYINTENRQFVRSLNNLIWKGESVFATKWQLSQSKLYGLLTNNK